MTSEKAESKFLNIFSNKLLIKIQIAKLLKINKIVQVCFYPDFFIRKRVIYFLYFIALLIPN